MREQTLHFDAEQFDGGPEAQRERRALAPTYALLDKPSHSHTIYLSPATGTYDDRYKREGNHPGGKLSLTHPKFVDDLVLHVKHDNRPQPATIPRQSDKTD